MMNTSSPKSSGRNVLITASIITVGLLLSIAIIQHPLSQVGAVTIDCDIPNTEVYYKDRLLGVVPLKLTKQLRVDNGLPAEINPLIDHDGWCEGLLPHGPQVAGHPRLMLKAPPADASRYVSYETPWGLRTKDFGGRSRPGWYLSGLMALRRDGCGMVLRIALGDKNASTPDFVEVTIDAKNEGETVFTGFHPEIMLLWGTLDVQWQERFNKTFPLPVEWANFSPGQERQLELKFPKPTDAGDFSVFAVMHLFEDKTTDHLVSPGAMYSDSKLLHVARSDDVNTEGRR